jgi:hypothetical protein
MFRLLWVVMLAVALLAGATAAQNYGAFEGEFDFRWLKDGRNMMLLKPLKYTDPSGVEWPVPTGAETDGASIPQVFWSIAGGPFEGPYRDAAVVHDYYCQMRSRSWRDTHLVFYNAMRAAGVGEVKAKTLYGAVYYFGPRWGIGAAAKGPGGERGLTEEDQKRFVTQLERWIETNQPDLDALNRELDNPSFPNFP